MGLVNIVAINLPCATPLHGPTYRTHHLAEAWTRMGHRVTFVGSSFSHLLLAPAQFAGPTQVTELNGVRYVLLKTLKYRGSGMLRALNVLVAALRLQRHERLILNGARPDVVLAASVYQVDNYWAERVARRHTAAFVRETRDLWPLTLIEVGGLSRWNPFVQWVQRAEDFGYRHADLVSSTLSNSYEYMRTRGLSADRWVYLPQCPPPRTAIGLATPLPAEHAQALEQAARSGKFIVVFTGSLVVSSGLQIAMEVARLLRSEPLAFLFVGQGPLEASLKAYASAQGLANVKFLPPVPRACVPEILRQGHAGLLGYLDRPIYRYGCSQNKLFDYMQNGLPSVFFCAGPGNPIAASGGGLAVPSGDPTQIAAAIRQLASTPPEERQRMGARAKAFVAEHHDLQRVAARYVELFGRLMRNQPAVNCSEKPL